jgi:transposase InsO family protein
VHTGHSQRELLLAWRQCSNRQARPRLCHLSAVQNNHSQKYGNIPLPTHHKLAPWEQVHVDLIGPWDVRYNSTSVPGKSTIEKIQALTIMDKATGWPEFIAIQNKTSQTIALSFDSEWLCRYPRPAQVIYNNGTEFTGQVFQELLESYCIKPLATTVRNPWSNGVIEHVHLTMGDML